MQGRHVPTVRLLGRLGLFIVTLLGAAWVPAAARGATYYVRQSAPDDAGDGLTPATAWRHLARLSGALQAGDTAYVGPGLYREELSLRNGGTLEHRITLVGDASGAHTGDPPGAVIVSGAEPVDSSIFRASGDPGVWVADFAAFTVWGVVEMDGDQARYARAVDTKQHAADKLAEVDVVKQLPSSFHYDDATKRLWVHTSDGRVPSAHEIELVERGTGISAVGKPAVVITGFTLRHQARAGISFFNGADDGIAVANVSFGGHQGIEVTHSARVGVYANVLFRNDNSGAYFLDHSNDGMAIGNVCYENVKGIRLGSESTGTLVAENVLFDNLERGLSIEHADRTSARRNRLVDNRSSQLLVIESEYDSDENCFQSAAPDAVAADFFASPADRWKTLADYRAAKGHDRRSTEGGCGSLPAKLDVHVLGKAPPDRARVL